MVIDYLQLCRGMADNRVNEIAEISMGMKAIAKELQHPSHRPVTAFAVRLKTETTSGPNCPICGNRARSNRTPTW